MSYVLLKDYTFFYYVQICGSSTLCAAIYVAIKQVIILIFLIYLLSASPFNFILNDTSDERVENCVSHLLKIISLAALFISLSNIEYLIQF